MNENKTNAPIKLPVRYENLRGQRRKIIDAENNPLCEVLAFASVSGYVATQQLYPTDENFDRVGKALVAALNEADALRADEID